MFTNRITRIFNLLFLKKERILSVQEFHTAYRDSRCSPEVRSSKLPGGHIVTAPYIYKNVHIKPAILDIKRGFWGNRAVAITETLADELIAEEVDCISKFKPTSESLSIIIHVPSSAYAKGRKNFDHMEQGTKRIEKLCENFFIPVTGAVQINKSALRESQHNLKRKERILSNKGKFYLNKNFIDYLHSSSSKDLHIYCIDDITTTGSTFDSVANLIQKELPSAHIICIAMAR